MFIEAAMVNKTLSIPGNTSVANTAPPSNVDSKQSKFTSTTNLLQTLSLLCQRLACIPDDFKKKLGAKM